MVEQQPVTFSSLITERRVTGDKYTEEEEQGDAQVIIGRRKRFFKGQFDLQGQLAPSGVLDGVLPSGQQPNSVLSQDERSSAVGTVVLATVGPGEVTHTHTHTAAHNNS